MHRPLKSNYSLSAHSPIPEPDTTLTFPVSITHWRTALRQIFWAARLRHRLRVRQYFPRSPDRGPNAVSFDSTRRRYGHLYPTHPHHHHGLKPNNGAGLPFTLTPKLRDTTLLLSLTPLVYGTGDDLAVGSGVPPQNNFLLHYFSGRSDNFDPTQTSGNPRDARLDPKASVCRTTDSGFTSRTSTALMSTN